MPTEGTIAFSMPSDCPQILTVHLLSSNLIFKRWAMYYELMISKGGRSFTLSVDTISRGGLVWSQNAI